MKAIQYLAYGGGPPALNVVIYIQFSLHVLILYMLMCNSCIQEPKKKGHLHSLRKYEVLRRFKMNSVSFESSNNLLIVRCSSMLKFLFPLQRNMRSC